jgi:ubiquitin C-terminal hydrolase
MNPDLLSQLPVDAFIHQITYLSFKDVMSLCCVNTTLRGYCSDLKYRNKWKHLIDSTFQNISGYQDISTFGTQYIS